MRFKSLIILIAISMLVMACDSRERVPAPEAGQTMRAPAAQSAPEAHKIYVDEVMQGNTYTYLNVTEGDLKYWIATAKQPIEAGMTLYYDQGLEMKEFTSKEVNKTFDSIWFVGKLRGTSSAAAAQMSGGTPKAAVADGVNVEKIEGGVSVKELYDGKAGFEGKSVAIRGTVTKFNASIMGRNWVHIQDGTSSGNYVDVTITTDAVVNMGDVVVFQGLVSLNKDFGAGYKYDVIIEGAKLVVNS